MAPSHVFQDPTFWKHFKNKVMEKSWKCNFPPQILIDNIQEDSMLYKDPSVFERRRKGVLPWAKNDTQWVQVLLGACQELARGRSGPYSQQLSKLHVLEALEDFVEHLNCFNTVAMVMASEGQPVKPLSQDSSQVHDIDKLDPIMLVGYSERFEDQVSTSVWQKCVERHTLVNPHHQAHCMWHDCHCMPPCVANCEKLRSKALREMVCDKVSRRLQKTLNGTLSKDMWDVELTYFDGLPQEWLDRAESMMQGMKQ
ncbi:uncharacterized protein LOC129227540 isoform X2 [Uloborus diversus]|nr:uncharacterized protein LOC129227540 isoform X2 [Uloborus diversus]XP_054718092.1 uncharacterized protein LOC129227540 isoform X2 [Uloborus diversus]XP_054718093.1 uncharacterized protein LOC129227540 isoform X2 [Uloborus diversus]